MDIIKWIKKENTMYQKLFKSKEFFCEEKELENNFEISISFQFLNKL